MPLWFAQFELWCLMMPNYSEGAETCACRMRGVGMHLRREVHLIAQDHSFWLASTMPSHQILYICIVDGAHLVPYGIPELVQLRFLRFDNSIHPHDATFPKPEILSSVGFESHPQSLQPSSLNPEPRTQNPKYQNRSPTSYLKAETPSLKSGALSPEP